MNVSIVFVCFVLFVLQRQHTTNHIFPTFPDMTSRRFKMAAPNFSFLRIATQSKRKARKETADTRKEDGRELKIEVRITSQL